MSNVTLPDIRLRDYTLGSLPRLQRLRDASVQARAEICIERATYVTDYLQHGSSDATPIELRYAEAVRHYLSHKAPLFFDNNLLAGSTTSKPFGAPVYPESIGMTIWPELDTISTREKNPLRISDDDAKMLAHTIFPYWMERNILERTRAKHEHPVAMNIFERVVFFIAGKAGCISHTVPCFSHVLERGLLAIRADATQSRSVLAADARHEAEFYQAVEIAIDGMLAYARALSQAATAHAQQEADPERRANLLAMAQVCARVPAYPASTFREAVNMIWLCQVAIHAENVNMAMSPGRLDQVLYPYYRHDIEAGTLTLHDALECLGCLWLKLNDNTDLVPETAEELFGGAGTVPAVTVGGVDADGNDAVNELTYLMLRVTELLKTRDPSLNARYHYEANDAVYLQRVAEVVAETKAVPAFHNDVADIATLVNQGVRLEHARDYAIIGCVELASAGRSYDSSSSIMLNLVSVLELALYNGRRPITGNACITFESGDPTQFRTFDDFWTAFAKQLGWMIDAAVDLNNSFGFTYQEAMPSPLLSTFFEGPLQSGKDLIFGGALYNSSGATHIGFADTVDSLAAIDETVFREQRCTFAQLLDALQHDFAGYEDLHTYLVQQAPKYGSDHPLAAAHAQALLTFLFEKYQSRTNYRGGKYRPAFWTMTNHAGQGKLSGALPSGRRAHKVFASGITPVSQAADELTACLQGVSALNNLHIPGGEALNLKYPLVDLADSGDLAKFTQTITTYFQAGRVARAVQYYVVRHAARCQATPGKIPRVTGARLRVFRLLPRSQ